MIRCKTLLHNSSDNLKTTKKHKVKNHSKGGLRVVALFEATKGLLVVFVGFGLLAFIHKDLHSVAEQLVRHFHLNPARHHPMIFIDAAQRLTDRYLWAMAFSALLYSTVRFVEAYGSMASEAVGQMVRTSFGSNVRPCRTGRNNAKRDVAQSYLISHQCRYCGISGLRLMAVTPRRKTCLKSYGSESVLLQWSFMYALLSVFCYE